MPDDRFEDLRGPGSPAGRTGPDEPRSEDGRPPGERLAELDALEPPPKPPPARPASRYAWVVGVAFLALIIVAGANSLRTQGTGALRGFAPGERLPGFAAPLASGALEGDANVRQRSDASDSSGGSVACEVRGPGVLNVCELWRDRPVVLSLIVTRGADCEPQLDRVERVRRDFPEVNFAGVVSGNARADVERLARARGWGFPVGVDPDGAVINLYRVGVCPTTTFAEAGGRVRETKLGMLTEADLRRSVRALARASDGSR